jgi:hypothetical protein
MVRVMVFNDKWNSESILVPQVDKIPRELLLMHKIILAQVPVVVDIVTQVLYTRDLVHEQHIVIDHRMIN